MRPFGSARLTGGVGLAKKGFTSGCYADCMSFPVKLKLLLAAGSLPIFLAAAWLVFIAFYVVYVVLALAGSVELPPNQGFTAVVLGSGALATAVYCRYGLKRGARVSSDPLLQRSLLLQLSILPGCALAVLAVFVISSAERASRAEQWNSARQQHADTLARFKKERFVPRSLEVRKMDGTFQASARLAGSRPGRYRISWRVRENLHGKVVLADSEVLTLDMPRGYEITFSQDELARGWADQVLHRTTETTGVGAGTGGPFALDLRVIAVLSKAEIDQLPEQVAALSPERALTATSTIAMPVDITIYPDGSGGWISGSEARKSDLRD